MSASAYHFTPHGSDPVEACFPAGMCSVVEQTREHLRIRIHAEAPLSSHSTGRLLILNAKCRAEGIRLEVVVPAPLYDVLCQLDLHRILWLDLANP